MSRQVTAGCAGGQGPLRLTSKIGSEEKLGRGSAPYVRFLRPSGCRHGCHGPVIGIFRTPDDQPQRRLGLLSCGNVRQFS